MTLKLVLVAAALAAALASGIAALAGNGTPIDAASKNPLTVAVIGDVPYGDVQERSFEAWPSAINADPKVDVAVHLGDIKSGSRRCDDSYYTFVAGAFDAFKDPVVYTPGDNEWTDCHRANNGAYDPLERLTKLRETFFTTPGVTLGGRKKQVLAQPSYPENVLWMQSQTIFVAVHVVGSNNSLAPWTGNTAPTPAQASEATARIVAATAWIDEAFDTAEREDARGLVLLMQADTFEGANETLAGFSPILARLQARAAAFDGPVLLLQGDTHSYVEDYPLPVPGLTRIVVEGSDLGRREYLRLRIDPGSQQLFSWERVPF
jgi:hypothetical protein